MNELITQHRQIEITRLDGTCETTHVRLLKIAEIPRYLELAEDEVGLAAFVTGRDAEWIGALTIDGVLDICEAAHDLNFQHACRWAQRRVRQNEGLLPMAQAGKRLQSAWGNSAPTAPSPSARPVQRSPLDSVSPKPA